MEVYKPGGEIVAAGRELIDAVLALYRQGASKRHVVDGVNRDGDSVALFLEACQQWHDLSMDHRLSALEQAEARHHAASSCAPGNGNRPELQGIYNNQVLTLLGAVPAEQRSSKWQELHDKIVAGLMENGFVPFNENQYREIVERQLAGGLKDAPGRAEYLLNYLREEGRIREAKQFAKQMKPHLAREGVQFARNQVQRLEAVILTTLEVESITSNTSDEESDDSDPADPANPATGPPVALGSFAPASEPHLFLTVCITRPAENSDRARHS